MRTDDRGHVEDVPRRWRKSGRAGQDRVTDGGRYPGDAGGEDLGHEEGVALRLPVEVAGVHARALRHLGHGLVRERLEVPPMHRREGRQVTEEDSQRMMAAHLIVT